MIGYGFYPERPGGYDSWLRGHHMTVLVECPETPMAEKKRGRPATSDRKDVSVKIDVEVKAMAQYVAVKRGVDLAQYLTESLRPTVQRDFNKESKGGP